VTEADEEPTNNPSGVTVTRCEEFWFITVKTGAEDRIVTEDMNVALLVTVSDASIRMEEVMFRLCMLERPITISRDWTTIISLAIRTPAEGASSSNEPEGETILKFAATGDLTAAIIRSVAVSIDVIKSVALNNRMAELVMTAELFGETEANEVAAMSE
jgi:hypothetical protein